MTYHWNIGSGGSLEDLLDEVLEGEVANVEERPDDPAGDDHDDGRLRDLGTPRPLDLLQLRPGLPDEAAPLLRLTAPGLLLRRCGARPDLLLARAGALRDLRLLGGGGLRGRLGAVALLAPGA